jgi:hypothetical protein
MLWFGGWVGGPCWIGSLVGLPVLRAYNASKTSILRIRHNSNMKPPSFAIAVTCTNERDGWIHPSLAMFLLEWAAKIAGPIRVVYNYRPHHNARNRAVELFQQDKCDWLFMIDNDTVPPGGVFQLLEQLDGRDVVAVPYPFHKIEGGKLIVSDCSFRYNSATDEIVAAGRILEPGFHEVAACGTGAVLIHRRVFERLEKPYFRSTENTNQPAEDIEFCCHARDAGFKIWTTADYGRAEHFKTIPLNHLY